VVNGAGYAAEVVVEEFAGGYGAYGGTDAEWAVDDQTVLPGEVG
jgi:hypothetical protein